MNDKLISFIVCVNDEYSFYNCKRFINELYVPNGYNIEIVGIRDAKSITSGYNSGMDKAKGKYKVYLHQDVYIVNYNFIKEIINIFENDDIGLIGVAGVKNMPLSGVWWEDTSRFGSVYEFRYNTLSFLDELMNPIDEYEEVIAIDGLIMITQYDIKWREDIFDGWHFYDMSQSIEFKKVGKKVVVPMQSAPWCIHDCGIPSMDKYYHYRDIFVNEYKNILFR